MTTNADKNVDKNADMNADTTYFDAQPRSTLELISQTVHIFSKHFGHFAALSLLVMGPIALLGVLGGAFFGQATFNLQQNMSNTGSSVQAFSQVTSSFISSCTSLLGLIAGAFFPWMEGALTYSLFERVLGRTPGVRDAYRATQGRFTALWGSNFLARLGLAAPLLLVSCIGGLVLAVIIAIAGSANSGDGNPGLAFGLGAICLVPLLAAYLIYLAVMGVNWRFRAPAIVAEGVDATRSLGRSMELVKGQRGSLLGRMVVFWLIEAVFVGGPILAARGLSLASYQITDGSGLAFAGSILFLLIGAVAQLLIRPLHLIYVGLLYLDVRVRKENLFMQPAKSVVLEPVLIPAVTTPPALPPIAPVITLPNSAPTAPTPPINTIGVVTTPAQKIGALFNRIRTEGPSADLLNDLGMAYMDVGDLGGALDSLTRAREIAPADADIAYNLVLLHRARRDTPSARRMMQEYLRLETNPADVERVRGDARFSDLL